MPAYHMVRVRLQVSARRKVFVVAFQVQVMRLEEHHREDGCNGTREAPELLVNILGHCCDEVDEGFVVTGRAAAEGGRLRG